MTFSNELMVAPGKRVKLSSLDPRRTLHFGKKGATEKATAEDAAEINRLQDLLYAEGKRALLVILQGIDTAGKDGTIRDVFNATGPLGVRATAFRRPSEEDLSHDYLWRVHAAAPARGTIGIFNRSHYEDVLIVRVRKGVPADEIERRYAEINAFEKQLTENGTKILKFMLHISKDEQRERLQERLDNPAKQWKFNPDDLEDRKRWDEFEAAYEMMLSRCSTKWAPWYVIPADRNWVRSAAIAAIVRATLTEMAPAYPKPDWNPKDFKIT